MGDVRENLVSTHGSDLDGEVVIAVLDDLGQRQIEAAVGDRAGVHRHAEARTTRLPALDGDDEQIIGSRPVGRIWMAVSQEHSVEDPDPVQLARARTEKRVAWRLPGRLRDFVEPAVIVDKRPPQLHLGGQLVLLERVWSDGITEQGLVLAPPEPVVAAVLLVGPPDRQIAAARNLVIDDRLLTNGGSDDRVAPGGEGAQQRVEVAPFDDLDRCHRCELYAVDLRIELSRWPGGSTSSSAWAPNSSEPWYLTHACSAPATAR